MPGAVLGHGSDMAVTETGHAAAREIDDLYRRHGGEVYRYALAVLGNHADAEDVTQTTFLNAYRSLEQGVRPRKPSNWLLTIASNAIKQRFRQEQARPRQVELDDRIADRSSESTGPTVGEILTALSHIAPQQRQAIVLREFEGRSYKEIAEILNVTVSALETLLFRARRSLAEELEHQLTCTEAQFAVSQAADGRLGRKERRRLRVAPRRVSRLRTVRAGSETPSAGTSRARVGPDSGLPHALPGLRGLGVCRDASGDRCGNRGRRRVRQRGGRRGRRHLRRWCGAQGRGGRHGGRCRRRCRGRRRHRDRVQGQEQASRQGREGREAAWPDGSSRGAAFRDAESPEGRRTAPGQTKADNRTPSQLVQLFECQGHEATAPTPRRKRRARAFERVKAGRRKPPGRIAPRRASFRRRIGLGPTSPARKSGRKRVGPRKSPPSRSGKR